MIKSRQLAKALYELSGEHVENLDAKFFDFIKKRKLEAQLPSVLYHLEKIAEADLEKKGIQIEVAHQISQDVVHKIKHFLEKGTGIDFSKKRDVVKVKKELVGGFRAKYDGVIYDSSIATGLKKLEELIIK